MRIHILIRSVVLVSLVLSTSLIYADKLTGKVTDSKTGEPLAGAQVFVKNTFLGTTTDVN